MSILHTVNKSPFEKNSLASCIKHANPGNAVLLIEDGVYGAITSSSISDTVTASMGNIKIFALKPDLDTRGIGDSHILKGVTLVDYAGFVDLVTQYDKVQSWL
jgi:tRNA 2-thiouridine synthesizing protein B